MGQHQSHDQKSLGNSKAIGQGEDPRELTIRDGYTLLNNTKYPICVYAENKGTYHKSTIIGPGNARTWFKGELGSECPGWVGDQAKIGAFICLDPETIHQGKLSNFQQIRNMVLSYLAPLLAFATTAVQSIFGYRGFGLQVLEKSGDGAFTTAGLGLGKAFGSRRQGAIAFQSMSEGAVGNIVSKELGDPNADPNAVERLAARQARQGALALAMVGGAKQNLTKEDEKKTILACMLARSQSLLWMTRALIVQAMPIYAGHNKTNPGKPLPSDKQQQIKKQEAAALKALNNAMTAEATETQMLWSQRRNAGDVLKRYEIMVINGGPYLSQVSLKNTGKDKESGMDQYEASYQWKATPLKIDYMTEEEFVTKCRRVFVEDGMTNYFKQQAVNRYLDAVNEEKQDPKSQAFHMDQAFHMLTGSSKADCSSAGSSSQGNSNAQAAVGGNGAFLGVVQVQASGGPMGSNGVGTVNFANGKQMKVFDFGNGVVKPISQNGGFAPPRAAH